MSAGAAVPGSGPVSGRQLALGVGFNAARRLGNFVPGANDAVLGALRALVRGEGAGHLYLRGAPGSGKTHLLQACCAEVQAGGARVAYLPLADRAAFPRGLLAGLAGAALLCLDDVDRAVADADWETALFHLYNEAEAAGARLLFSGRAGPAAARLPDLRSRLCASLVLDLAPPDDAQRARVLQQRARDLGFELPDDAVAWVLARRPRDLARLTALVEGLDRYALAAKRRVTLALVREFLERGG